MLSPNGLYIEQNTMRFVLPRISYVFLVLCASASHTIKDMSLRTKCGDQFLLSVPQPSWYLVLFQLCRYNDLSSESTQWGLCKGFETLQAFLRTLCCNCYFSCPLGRVTTKKKGVFWFAWLVIKYHKNSLLKKCILSTPNECSCVVFEY